MRSSRPFLPIVLAALLPVAAACAPAVPPSPPPAPAAPVPAAPTPDPAVAARAAEAALADFYKGKTVQILVGFAAGGGYDTYSRVIAKHIGKYIPGNPTVIVQNVPGAGSMVAANQVYSTQPKDGTIIGNISGPIVLEQLFGSPGAQFDMAKFRHLAVPTAEAYMMMVLKRTGITQLSDLLGPDAKQVVIGGIPGSTVEHAPILMRDALGANIKLVSGYDGTSKVRLAMESGEVDGFFNTWQSMKVTSLAEVQSGNWVLLMQLNDKGFTDLPGKVPTILDVAKTDEQRQLLLFGTSYPNKFGKLYVMAPEVPAERAAAIEAAFAKTFQDKEFLEEAQKANLEIAPLYGKEVAALIKEMLAMPEGIKEKLRKVMAAN